jgi:hypothetical protein
MDVNLGEDYKRKRTGTCSHRHEHERNEMFYEREESTALDPSTGWMSRFRCGLVAGNRQFSVPGKEEE